VLRPRTLWTALLLFTLGLPVLVCSQLARAGPIPAVPANSVAVLIVANTRTAGHKVKEDRIVTLIRQSMAEQGLPREMLPILVYHMDNPQESRYCETKLGIHKQDLLFLGLAEHAGGVVHKVILRENNVNSPDRAVQRLFMRAFKLVTGFDLPSTTPTLSTGSPEQPMPTPTDPGESSVRVTRPCTCKSVRSGGEPVDTTETFGPGDTVYVSLVAKGLTRGAALEVRWYQGDNLVRRARVASDKVGDYFVWFRWAPTGSWSPGRYHADVYADGKYQVTLYWRVEER
jgi:hypothetical protein